MRYWQAILPLAAAVAMAPAAAAEPEIYVMVAYTDEFVVLVQTTGAMPRARSTARASQVAYYAMPSFNLEGVPVRRTETEFEVDCKDPQSRRLHASAYRENGDRLGNESYSDAWEAVAPGTPMAAMRRVACVGVGPDDIVYTNLASALVAYGRLVDDTRAE